MHQVDCHIVGLSEFGQNFRTLSKAEQNLLRASHLASFLIQSKISQGLEGEDEDQRLRAFGKLEQRERGGGQIRLLKLEDFPLGLIHFLRIAFGKDMPA